MRKPSLKVLNQRCNVFVSLAGRGPGGGVQFPYPATPTFPNVPCSIQGISTEVVDDQRRITMITSYIVIFGRFLGLNPRDMIQYVDRTGMTRTIFVSAEYDGAGRGAYAGIPCTERE